VAEEIRDARPDILFVAISSPRKEYWLGRYGRTIDVPFVMRVGSAIDVVAGHPAGRPHRFSASGSNGHTGSPGSRAVGGVATR
jgi:N-acetylglucosaminyldiphosphoundecaprenol N-acetyl-beta-D-mannosaminyltransferase